MSETKGESSPSKNAKPVWRICDESNAKSDVSRRDVVSHNVNLWRVCNDLIIKSSQLKDGATIVKSGPSENEVAIHQTDIVNWFQALPSGSSDANSSHEVEDGDLSLASSVTYTTEDDTCSGIGTISSNDSTPITGKVDGRICGMDDGSAHGEKNCIRMQKVAKLAVPSTCGKCDDLHENLQRTRGWDTRYTGCLLYTSPSPRD